MAIINRERFGKAVAMERQLAGFSTRESFATAISTVTREPFSTRQVGSIERGEAAVTFDLFLAILMVLPDFATGSIRRSLEPGYADSFDVMKQFNRV